VHLFFKHLKTLEAGFPFSCDTGGLFARARQRRFCLQVAGAYLIRRVRHDLLGGEDSILDDPADRMTVSGAIL
jgi:hypothetical protein